MTEQLLRRYYEEVWVAWRVDALDELLTPDYVDRVPPPGFGPGHEDARRFAAAFAGDLGHPHLEILALVATADTAAAHWRLEWTQDGQRRRMHGSDLIRVRDGRIAEIFHVERPLITAS